jgi:cation transport protein ChaC
MKDPLETVASESSTAGEAATQAADGIWVFAYGSLMWRPDFTPADIRPARLTGYHRSLCILSTIYRGTDDRPGLVLGLDRGGSCLGRALLVRPADWPAVKAMLDQRELVTGVYIPRFLSARLDDGRVVPAYSYVVDRSHWQYWTGDRTEAIRLIRQGQGKGGSSRDYLAQTVEQMDRLGIGRTSLHRMLAAVDG